MTFNEILSQTIAMLQQHGRVSYRMIKRQFDLDDDDLDDLKYELIEIQSCAVAQDDKMLVWAGDTETASSPPTSVPVSAPTLHPESQDREPVSYTPQHLADKILTSRSALEGERKPVTVMFCDLARSTALAERTGPEAMHTLLNRFFELALDDVHRYEGTINQFLGDGFMALFGAPIAHEDHARRAVLAALALQHTLQEHHAELGEPHGVTCQFRMGLNSGIVVVGSIGDNLRMDYSAIGDTTNLASRLQGIAEPGEILASASTSRLLQGYIRLEELPPLRVKGKTDAVMPYRVTGTLPRRSPMIRRGERTLSQFVGRERELAVLNELFEQVESGHGQVVGIVAEAGSGKSRLLYEFRQRLQDEQVTYLEGRCLSYGSTIPYHPIIDVVRNNCDITENDKPDVIGQKIRLRLEEVEMDAEESASYLLQLLGVREGTESIAMLTPEAVRTRTFDTLKQLSLKSSQQRLLIVELEDLHWCDKTSEGFLTSLVESLAGASILLLTTYRPGYRPPWIDKSYATQISLHHLTPQDGLTIVHSALHGATLPGQVEQMIIDKAEGNPFFLEELTHAISAHGDAETDLDVPDTVQGVLMARIDRLPEASKRLLQTASVLGREFSPTVLKAIWPEAEALEPLLLKLKRLEFLFERSGVEEPVYVFKHALTQDVAYESLLTTRRQTLHAAAAQSLERLYGDRLEEVYDRLAYHYARTDNAAKAVTYLTLVAEEAARGHAHAEAAAVLQEALRHAKRLTTDDQDRHILNLVIRQADCLFFLGRRQEAVEQLLGHQTHLLRLQDPVVASAYHERLSLNYSFQGNREASFSHAQRALEEALRGNDALTTAMAYVALCREGWFAGRLLQAVEHGERAVALIATTTDRYLLGHTSYVLSIAYYFLGDFEQSLQAIAQTEIIGAAIGDRRLRTNGASFRGNSLAAQGDWQAAIAACEEALVCSPDAYEAALVRGTLGCAYMEKGDLAAAIPILEQAVDEAIRYRSLQVQSWHKVHLGEAYCANGQLDQARDLGQQALQLASGIQHRWGVGLAQRLLGRTAYAGGDLAEAQSRFQEALATLASIHSRFELARTHLDLASLAHTQENPDTTTTHLSTAHAWFKKLQVPKWAERTEQLAHAYGVTLTAVELEALTKEPS